MMIISKTANEAGIHSIESHNWLTEPEQIPDGFIEVPAELEQVAMESSGWCELEIGENGELAGITPTEKPPAPEVKPSNIMTNEEITNILNALLGVKTDG